MEVIDCLKQMLVVSSPVEFREFVTSPDYCNNSSLYDYWHQKAINIPDDCQELILDGSLGCRPLYTTYHTMPEGIPMSDLDDTDALIQGEDGKYHKIMHVANVGMKSCRRVWFSDGSVIEATEDHCLKVLDNTGRIHWRRVDSIKPDDLILVSNAGVDLIESWRVRYPELLDLLDDAKQYLDIHNPHFVVIKGLPGVLCRVW